MLTPTTRRKAAPVEHRTIKPDTGWTLEDARAMVAQGYSVEHVANRTGWPEKVLKARQRANA